jgi:hypothetical protein
MRCRACTCRQSTGCGLHPVTVLCCQSHNIERPPPIRACSIQNSLCCIFQFDSNHTGSNGSFHSLSQAHSVLTKLQLVQAVSLMLPGGLVSPGLQGRQAPIPPSPYVPAGHGWQEVQLPSLVPGQGWGPVGDTRTHTHTDRKHMVDESASCALVAMPSSLTRCKQAGCVATCIFGIAAEALQPPVTHCRPPQSAQGSTQATTESHVRQHTGAGH